jgi:hypothetical protein
MSEYVTMQGTVRQPPLFDRDQYRATQVVTHTRSTHSTRYQRWWCSPVHDRQRYECLVRQKFRCDYCGYLLGRYFDTHHTSYDNLGYEEATDLVALHRRCHRILETARQSELCGCQRLAA